jgi:hypothetical protein
MPVCSGVGGVRKRYSVLVLLSTSLDISNGNYWSIKYNNFHDLR